MTTIKRRLQQLENRASATTVHAPTIIFVHPGEAMPVDRPAGAIVVRFVAPGPRFDAG